MSLEKVRANRKFQALPRESDIVLGSGSFGTVRQASVVAQLLEKNADGNYQVTRQRDVPGVFVTKTYKDPDPEEAIHLAKQSVENYRMLKGIGVKHLPKTYRSSSTQPQTVIASHLALDGALITSNSGPERSVWPSSFTEASVKAMLEGLEQDILVMSHEGWAFKNRDVYFFKVHAPRKSSGALRAASDVDFVYGDFDTLDPFLSDDKEALKINVTVAVQALFALMLYTTDRASWKSYGAIVHGWANKFRIPGLSVPQIYQDFIEKMVKG